MTKTLTLMLASALLVTLAPAQASDHSIDGRWNGVVFGPEGEVPFTMDFTNVEGELAATVDAPQLGIVGLEVERVSRDGDSVSWIVPIPDAPVELTGEFQEDGLTIKGTTLQLGVSADSELTRPAD